MIVFQISSLDLSKGTIIALILQSDVTLLKSHFDVGVLL